MQLTTTTVVVSLICFIALSGIGTVNAGSTEEKEFESAPPVEEEEVDIEAYCSSFSSCDVCGAAAGGKCGWCYATEACEPGNKKGPSRGWYYCMGDQWAYPALGKKPCKMCAARVTQLACTGSSDESSFGCGWCGSDVTLQGEGPGQCQSGDHQGPHFTGTTCPGGWTASTALTAEVKKKEAEKKCPCWIKDDTLDKTSLQTMHDVFSPKEAPYWMNHKYSADPPSGFYSYVFPLDKAELYGPLGELALEIKELAAKNIPSGSGGKTTSERCRYAEVWAHNRPPQSGHQMHYDSDDEGRNGIRNPVAGSIFYLSEAVGGPTLITDRYMAAQRNILTRNNGWLCFPKLNRLTVFDGRVYHGVVSGKPFPKPEPESPFQRRVTVMIALWEDIKVRDEKSWGSARPFPIAGDGISRGMVDAMTGEPLKYGEDSNALKSTHQQWVDPIVGDSINKPKERKKSSSGQAVDPHPLGHKWEAYVAEAQSAPEHE